MRKITFSLIEKEGGKVDFEMASDPPFSRGEFTGDLDDQPLLIRMAMDIFGLIASRITTYQGVAVKTDQGELDVTDEFKRTFNKQA